MSQPTEAPIDATVSKHRAVDLIKDEVLKKYNLTRDELLTLYEQSRFYGRVLQAHRKEFIDKAKIREKAKEQYICEACRKPVRVSIRYHHMRTKKHILLQEELDASKKESANE
jgi:hypothetical protein